ncbi:MAG: enoyl-CoA hydratase/isomerase family protein [Rhodopseudomonas sp.]|uniref:enoyl-CoA hydratase-related protein n=1 Tax=Rhodopseudomonas sp. TaxID=1078 RepID=UPI001817FECD|nr:enoyl-CoA hydratase-related protein [Rhodopseudomonas sp.]NVN85722.1 enoyl-CoA hydratase/isomerase family protein [Rhodopseudomonas sp.]
MPDILISRQDGVALVSLNRPELRNAVTLAMWRDLASVFADLGRDADVRAVVLSGAGADFSVGADISEFDRIRDNKQQSADYEIAVDACSAAIADLAKPVIAAISGYCLGGGCHLALACDFRFASPTALIGIPSARLSIVYGVNSVQRLLALVGIANAKRLLYSADRLTAAQAQAIGLVDECSADAVVAAVAYATRLAANAPLSIAGAKFILNALAMGNGALDLAAAARLIDQASDSEDFREGRRAFAERRPPRFVGR